MRNELILVDPKPCIDINVTFRIRTMSECSQFYGLGKTEMQLKRETYAHLPSLNIFYLFKLKMTNRFNVAPIASLWA